jgi:hypothetical protein
MLVLGPVFFFFIVLPLLRINDGYVCSYRRFGHGAARGIRCAFTCLPAHLPTPVFGLLWPALGLPCLAIRAAKQSLKDLCAFLPGWVRQFSALVECEPDIYKHNMPHPITDAAVQM